MNSGSYIFVVNGVPRTWPSRSQIYMLGLWMFGISLTCLVSPAEFIFRYFLVVKNVTLGWMYIARVAVLVALFSLLNTILITSALLSVENHDTTFGGLMTDPMWIVDGERASFFGAQRSNTFFQCFISSVATEVTGCFVLMALCSAVTLRTLSKQRFKMSKKTRYMESQINRLMFAEFISLTLVFVVPINLAMLFLFMKIKYVGLGVVIAMLISWVPAVNPLTTILLVGPYRRQLLHNVFKRCRRLKTRISTVSTTDSMNLSRLSHIV